MPPAVLKNVSPWVVGYDFAPDSNQVVLPIGVATEDGLSFDDDGWAVPVPATRNGALRVEGFLRDQAEPDLVLFGLTDAFLASIVPTRPAAVGDITYFMKAMKAENVRRLEAGKLYGLSANFPGQGPMRRGQVLAAFIGSTPATAGAGTSAPLQVGAVGATQKAYIGLHVFSLTGTAPTFDGTVETDGDSGFASPDTQVTFTQVVPADIPASSWQWWEVVGAISDDWWRIAHNIGGTGGPTCLYAVVIAIA